MRRVLPLVVLAALLSGLSAHAFDKTSAPPLAPASQARAVQPDESKLVEHRSYTNKKGEVVHSPAHPTDGKVPSGATAKCGDGTYSFSHSRRGTCSHHGGVAQWL